MIVNLTQQKIDAGLFCEKSKQELVDDNRTGLYILITANSKGHGTFYWRGEFNFQVHHPSFC